MSDDLERWYHGRRVLVTGHTGFKGSWLVAWLRKAGAEVTGYALPPEAGRRSLFEEGRLADGINSVLGDVRDPRQVERCMAAAEPEVVFHLAAQSLVRRSYREPVETFATNVMGTVHVLDAVRRTPSVRGVVVVTSDKCYENDGSGRAHAEEAPFGGHDPYSASKGCAELVSAAWRRSYLAERGVAVATARAGNVFGGGDWAEDRLLPDLFAAAGRGDTAILRNPWSVRPWQYVLEPLRGYLLLGRALVEHGNAFAEGWNFGPGVDAAVPVRYLAERIGRIWDRVVVREAPEPGAVHEAAHLVLDASKARERLGWLPFLTLDDSLSLTAAWYRDAFASPASIPDLVLRGLDSYRGRLAPALIDAIR